MVSKLFLNGLKNGVNIHEIDSKIHENKVKILQAITKLKETITKMMKTMWKPPTLMSKYLNGKTKNSQKNMTIKNARIYIWHGSFWGHQMKNWQTTIEFCSLILGWDRYEKRSLLYFASMFWAVHVLYSQTLI